MKRKNRFSKITATLINMLLPSRCPICYTNIVDTDISLCRSCVDSILSEPYLQIPSPSDNIEKVWSVHPYTGLSRECLRNLKYRAHKHLIEIISLMIQNYLALPPVGFFDKPFDMILSVPTHPARLAQRGFDHVKLILSSFCQIYGNDDILHGKLIKTSQTLSQAGLPKISRLNNLKGTFGLDETLSVKGLNLLLIDDITTTGATLDACGEILYSAGANSVSGFTISKTL